MLFMFAFWDPFSCTMGMGMVACWALHWAPVHRGSVAHNWLDYPSIAGSSHTSPRNLSTCLRKHPSIPQRSSFAAPPLQHGEHTGGGGHPGVVGRRVAEGLQLLPAATHTPAHVMQRHIILRHTSRHGCAMVHGVHLQGVAQCVPHITPQGDAALIVRSQAMMGAPSVFMWQDAHKHMSSCWRGG